MRPANIITAFADILAGFAVAGGLALFNQAATPGVALRLGWLLISTFGLYGGGVVFNDVFDAELDARERPERAIPSGKVTRHNAIWLGSVLLSIGVLAAFLATILSGVLAVFIVLCALFYNAKAKYSTFFGPFFMGVCRAGNLLLGCSIIAGVAAHFWMLGLFPVIYIGAITLVSQGEVHGGKKTLSYFALGLIILVIIALSLLSYLSSYTFVKAIPFIILFTLTVFPPFFKVTIIPSPERIKHAVKRGVLSLILLNSVLAAGFSGFILGGIILVLLPISIWLSTVIAVT